VLRVLVEKPINLEALFSGGNPFEATRASSNNDAEVNSEDVPF
jgi:hypothetical protein